MPVIVRRQAVAEPALPADLHPLLRRVYAHRNLAGPEELARGLEALARPADLAGIGGAVDLLAAAVQDRRSILIVGDFDADGATSCALAVCALRDMGATRVDYLVPNRFEFGYGLTPEIVEVAAGLRPDLLITVDNGISSIEGVEAARERGMQVLVTDHHLPGATLPRADAIVNPNQPGCGFPAKSLAGVGVIFYVMLALRARLRETGWFERAGIAPPNLARLLDLVALGTVADVVPLEHTNRILVHQGLERIRAGLCRPGIAAMIEVAGRRREQLTEADIGFAVAPRLNAAGRLEDMALGVETLLCTDHAQARRLAARLDELNRERRAIEEQMQQQAMAALQRVQLDVEHLPFGICLFDAEWHAGVIGILASRVKERFHRPVIAFARERGSTLRGSARSVPGLHIRDALDAVATRHRGLVHRFGGHAMAAGLALDDSRLEAFGDAFDAEVRKHLAPDDLRGTILSDGELAAGEITLENAECLRDAGPWGTGFPEPVFDGEFRVVKQRVLADAHLKLVLEHPEGALLDAIAFRQAERHPEGVGAKVRAAYRLAINEWRGERSLQLIVEHVESA